MIKQWAEEFRSLGKQEMDTETTRIFMNLTMDSSGPDGKPPLLETHFGFQVTFNRAISIFSKVDWQAAAFIAILTDRPGAAVMYLYAIRVFYKELTMANIAFSFPTGFLSEENLSIMWEKQKIGGRNYLDTLTEDDFK